MTKRSNLSATLYILLVFLSGVVLGIFAHRLYMMHSVSAATGRTPEEWRRKYVDDMTRHLTLDAAQISQLQKILDETRQRLRDLHEKSKPEMKAIQDGQTQKIRAMLSEEQRSRFEKYRTEREHEREKTNNRKLPY